MVVEISLWPIHAWTVGRETPSMMQLEPKVRRRS